MRLSVAPWGESLDELVDAARAAEQAGADRVWTSELHRSATVPAAAVAAATSRVGVGTGIALAFVRSPLTIALEALDLDELSAGRFVLGLGTGVQRLVEDWHHATFGQPVAHLRETVAAVRAVTAGAHLGEPLELAGEWEPVRISGWQRPVAPARPVVPVYLASLGPALTRLSGEVADGWIGHELTTPRYLADRALPWLAEGLTRSGRKRADLEVVASACCVADPDGRQAHRWAAGLVAFYATVKTYSDFFAFHGFAAEAAAVRAAFRRGDEAAMVNAVPDEMVDVFTLAGTPNQIRERLADFAGLADTLKLSPPTHGVPMEVTREAQRGVLALVAEHSETGVPA